VDPCPNIGQAGGHEADRHRDSRNADGRTNASRADPDTSDGTTPSKPGKGGPPEDLTNGHSNLLGLGSGAPQPSARNHLLSNT
jgi:hypothetical protein